MRARINLPVFHSMLPGSAMAVRSLAMLRRVSAIGGATNRLSDMEDACVDFVEQLRFAPALKSSLYVHNFRSYRPTGSKAKTGGRPPYDKEATGHEVDATFYKGKHPKTHLRLPDLEKGFEGLRFQDVAERAGVNNATLLHRFPSKEALIQGVVHYLTGEMRAPRTGDEMAPKDPIEELRREFEELRRFLEDVPAFFVVLTEIALRARRDRKTARVVEGREKFWHQRLDELLQRGISQGVFRSDMNVEATITSLMVQVKGIAHHASLSPRGRDELPAVISEIADQVTERLTRGKSDAGRASHLGTRKYKLP